MFVEIFATQLAMLLDGLDFGRVRRPEHWKPPIPDGSSDRSSHGQVAPGMIWDETHLAALDEAEARGGFRRSAMTDGNQLLRSKAIDGIVKRYVQ